MSEYHQLTARFAEVRGAWKRTAALSGLAVVVTEGIGVLTVLLFLDWLYQPRPAVRVCMGAVALGGLAWIFARQVVRPLLRFIPDEQIALYIEEHQHDLDGVLITAAEYGRRRGEAEGGQAALIDVVVNEAASRAGATTTGVVDFTRLRKYGIAAAAGILIYLIMSALFPDTVAHHVGRVLNPWHATAEDLPARPVQPALIEPIKFSLSKGDASLQRGQTFDFEATLSRHPEQPVVLNFRPVVQGTNAAWQTLPMTEIEKLNGFQGALSDVSEDLEFYVSSGPDKSETHRLTVFDPLVVQSMEVTTHYPAYTKLPDRVESPSTGDVEALIGSTVTVRILTSTPLREGHIQWGGGGAQPLVVDPRADKTASFSFEVKADASYDYALTDANGQQAASTESLTVKAIPDNPPTLTLKSPKSPLLTNVLGEVNFEVEADDDFGVAGAELVFSRIDEKAQEHETHVPLTLVHGDTKSSPNAVRVTYKLMLEKEVPAFKPNDAISFHVEVRDTKGQVASSDLGLIIVGYFENWATWELPHTEEAGAGEAEGPDLMAMLSLVWTLNEQKTALAPADFLEQSKQIAGKMADSGGNMRDFANTVDMPQLAAVADKINGLATKAHAALLAADTATAASELRIAAILYAGNSILKDTQLSALDGDPGGGSAAGFAAPSLTTLEKANADQLSQSATDQAAVETEMGKTAAADAAGAAIDGLLKKEEGVIAQAKAGAGEEAGKEGGAEGESALAKAQKEIAAETKALGEKATAGDAAAGSKLGNATGKAAGAAKTMEAAAHDFETGNRNAGAEKAEAARKALAEARDELQGTSRDKLETAISDTAGKLDGLIEKQRAVRAGAESTAKEMAGGKAPDQRQKRDLQKEAYQEAGLQAEAQSLLASVSDLGAWADRVGEAEAVRALGEAAKTVKRGKPEGKMADAVIDLHNGTPGPVSGEMKSAEDALGKILDHLHEGSDALAASRDAQLRRAERTAAEAAKGLDQIAKGQRPDTGAEGKPGEQAKTDATSETQSGGGGDPQKVVYDIQRLATNLDNRDLVPQKDVDQLKEMSMDKADLEMRLAVDSKLLRDFSEIVSGIDQKLEAETAAKTEASKLFSSQREECPPEYRVFVNQYFEALSKVNAQPGPASQP